MSDASNKRTISLVVFQVDELRFALPLDGVDRIVRAVEVAQLPAAPPIVLGVIDVHGRVMPVLDVRRRFLGCNRAITPAHYFVLARTAHQRVALVVDAAEGVVHRPRTDVVSAARWTPGGTHFEGVLRLDDGLAVIHDLEKFLSADEAQALDQALVRRDPPAGSGGYGPVQAPHD